MAATPAPPGDDPPASPETLDENGDDNLDEDLNPLYRRAYERSRDAARKVLDRRFRLVRLARDAYRKSVEEEDAVARVKDDLLTLVRLVRAWARRDYRRVSYKTILSVVGAVIYFLTPVDAIPDFIPVVGLADDIAVISAVVRSARSELDDFREWEENEKLGGENLEKLRE